MGIKYTAIGSGYYRVFRNGIEISKHTSEREANERAVNEELANPASEVTYKHDYEVKVESVTIAPPVTPTPIPPTPTTFQLYSPTSYVNKKLSAEPLHANSSGLVAEMFENIKIAGGWVATTPYSHPIYYVNGSTVPKVKVYLTGPYAAGGAVEAELLKGVPIPSSVVIAAGTDAHLCIIDKDANREYDFYRLKPRANGDWEATSAGILDNVTTCDGTLEKRSDGRWNSATASHIPLALGVITLKELEAGVIPHGLFIAINRPAGDWQNWIWPAKSTDGYYMGTNAIQEGRRFRFPANIVINPAWTPLVKMIVTAVRDYGMVVGDKTGAGVSFYVEDPTQYGKGQEVLTPYLGTKKLWEAFGSSAAPSSSEFPWMQLEALA